MKLINTNELVVKKSKFIAHYYHVNSIDEIKNILSNIKKEHKRATHVVYAYKIDTLQKKFDDGEPGGTAGNPILNVILKNNLNEVLIIVIRYYGGIKLGSGGLIRAYNKSASEVIKENF